MFSNTGELAAELFSGKQRNFKRMSAKADFGISLHEILTVPCSSIYPKSNSRKIPEYFGT